MDAAELLDRLRPVADACGADVSEASAGTLAGYVELVLAWRQRINLTGARSAAEFVHDHIADALPVLRWLPGEAFDAIDVGSGAGLPGVVISALRPDARVTLLEPNQKKVAFLQHVRRELRGGIRVEVIRGRWPAADADGTIGKFDVALSRAVWPADEWLGRAEGLLAPNGRAIGFAAAGDLPDPAGPETRRIPYTLRSEGGTERIRALWVRDVG